MRDSQRYRYKAADCLRAAQQAHDPSHRAVHLSMASPGSRLPVRMRGTIQSQLARPRRKPSARGPRDRRLLAS